MAWTTSAGARARPTIAEVVDARLKRAKFRYATLRRSVLRAHPAAFLAVSAVTLGVLALLLPTGFIAATLVLSGVTVAVYAAGANLADAVSMARTEQVAVAEPAAAHADIAVYRSAPDRETMPVVKAARPRRTPPMLAAHHDWADLMSRVNHDLRTPLNAVIGFSEVMALEMFGPLGSERYKEYVRYIRESASDLLKSAEDTLALTALLTNARPAETAVACTLEHAIADAWTFVERKAAGRDVRLDLMLPEGVEVLAEPRTLRQILVNMLSEAVRAPLQAAASRSSPSPTASLSRSFFRSAAGSRTRRRGPARWPSALPARCWRCRGLRCSRSKRRPAAGVPSPCSTARRKPTFSLKTRRSQARELTAVV